MGDCTVLDLWWGCWRSMSESLVCGETVGSERFLENLRYQISNYYKNKNWEFVALRYEFPILAGAQGHELPLIQYFTSRNAVFSPLYPEYITIS